LKAILHIYHASFTIAENFKFITSIVSENTRGQGTTLKTVKTSISDVRINVFKIGKKCIKFKSLDLIHTAAMLNPERGRRGTGCFRCSELHVRYRRKTSTHKQIKGA
jgi:predicted GNAT family acetyltransferase